MEIEKEIKSAIAEALKDLGVDQFDIILDRNLSHGDFSTNVSLTIFHKTREKFPNPLNLAKHIVSQLQQKLPNIDRIEASSPGFINFWISQNYLMKNLEEVLKNGEKYGRGHSLKGQKIMLEFADPNPFKQFHIGHLRNISLGESYARLMEFQKAEVCRANYQGDVGMHVAKAIRGMREYFRMVLEDPKKVAYSYKNLDELREDKFDNQIIFLGASYALGAWLYDDKKEREKIANINKEIYQKGYEIAEYKLGRELSLRKFEEIYKRVDTKYDKYYFESQTEKPGRELVLSKLPEGVFEKHEGAIIFRGSHTRVFVTSDGHATYEAKDLALAKMKYDDFEYDKSIIITANEQIEYFKVVLEAMKKTLPDLSKKTIHESFGFVSLDTGKMSSRIGNVITGEALLKITKDRLRKEFKEMDKNTLEKVAVGAVKYSMLKFGRKSDITFSFDESISLEGNSGSYIQYTYARIQSVLAKIPNSKFQIPNKSKIKNTKLEKEEELILRLLIQFPEIVREAQTKFAPNILANYLFELSQAFNNFYQKHKIIGNREESFRLKLTSGVGKILKTGLYLLGIEAPEKM